MVAENKNLIKALIEFQKNNKCFKANKDNPYFKSKYIDLAQLIKDTREDLIDNDLCISQFCRVIDTKNILVTRLMHSSGEYLDSDYQLDPVKQDPQGMGSALTYARRYNYMAILGVASSEDDDDGNKASQQGTTKPNQGKTSSTKIIPKEEDQRSIVIAKAKECKVGKEQLTALCEEIAASKKINDYTKTELAQLLELIQKEGK